MGGVRSGVPTLFLSARACKWLSFWQVGKWQFLAQEGLLSSNLACAKAWIEGEEAYLDPGVKTCEASPGSRLKRFDMPRSCWKPATRTEQVDLNFAEAQVGEARRRLSAPCAA